MRSYCGEVFNQLESKEREGRGMGWFIYASGTWLSHAVPNR